MANSGDRGSRSMAEAEQRVRESGLADRLAAANRRLADEEKAVLDRQKQHRRRWF